MVTLADMMPVSLCIATQELFDAKRFAANFGDNLILRARDKELEPFLLQLKRELSMPTTQNKFLDGHKTVIISNIDKILGLVSSRYSHIDYKSVESIVKNGKEIIRKVLLADSFDQIAKLEPDFKSKITLPVYELFTESMKR
jgi:hypothetical protein